ncbi:MAG: YegS/Rv2252/BmrU family lipid kinase [Actinomycetota bacterium]|nr:YegS/Rv2252/BmrU family lipid kinase [Actinomycetota bacterium]
MRRWLVIVNSAAGRRATSPDAVRDALAAAGVDADIEAPESVEATVDLLQQEARAGRTNFALAGGDGTANLAANALLPLDMGMPTIAILPIGSGCDLLRTFGLPQDLGGAARHLATEDTYEIDIATLEGDWGLRYFLNVAQVGVGAAAAETAPKVSRKVGIARYPAAFLARLPRFPKARVTVTTERRTYESEALAVIMANAQFFAGGWNVAPRATLVDGVLDIQIINARKTQAAALVPKIIKGTHLNDPAVRRFSAAEFKIETEPQWPVEADGDPIGNTTVTGRVIPAAIRLKI